MKRLTHLFKLGLVALLLTACSPTTRSNTPEEVVRQKLSTNPSEVLQNVQIHTTRPWQGGVLVLYSGTRPGKAMEQLPIIVSGYALVEQQTGKWTVTEGRSFGSYRQPSLVAYDSDHLRDSVIVFGRALTPEVASVEATFDTDQNMQENIANGAFIVIASKASQLRELRVIGQNGQILQQYRQSRLVQEDTVIN